MYRQPPLAMRLSGSGGGWATEPGETALAPTAHWFKRDALGKAGMKPPLCGFTSSSRRVSVTLGKHEQTMVQAAAPSDFARKVSALGHSVPPADEYGLASLLTGSY